MRPLIYVLFFIGAAACAADPSVPVGSEPESTASVMIPAADVPGGQGTCGEATVALQVLGSGGPFLRDGRASSSYLLWVNGRARVMVDAGGGAFVRFGEAGARIEDLRLLGISHFHPDHSSDLPAILWVSNNFRSEPLPLIGPSRDEVFPGAVDFVSRLFDGADGAFPILSGTVGGDHLGFPLVVTEVDTKDSQPSLVFDEEDLKVSALGVPHNAPALAFRVEVENVSVVFGSDQIGTNSNFPEFARDASLLVMHLTNSESSAPNPIHALPSVVGRVAREAEARRLVLSHLTSVEREHRRFETTSLADLPANLAVVREHYKGEIIVASDLLCIDLGGS